MLSYESSADLIENGSDPQNIAYIELEMADYGSLFTFLKELGPLEPQIARFYFIQLIDALNFIHSLGISHRDIKPENLLLDQDYNIKLADFGLCSFEEFECKNIIGSYEYIPPECHSNFLKFQNKPLDIYEAGITFFNMFTGFRPWKSATENDIYFIHYLNDKNEFWKSFKLDKSMGSNREDFKRIFESMVSSTSNRLTIEEIMKLQFYKDCLITQNDVYKEMMIKYFEIEGVSRKGSLSQEVKNRVTRRSINSIMNFARIFTSLIFGS